MLVWSAKWLFSDTIYSGTMTPEESIMRDDKKITRELWQLIDEADIIIAHNLLNFDRKKMNTCFIKHGLSQPSPYQIIDTLKIAQYNFAISSNKLDYLCKFFGIPMKYDTGFQLWKDCIGADVVKESVVTKGNRLIKTIVYDKRIIANALNAMTKYCNHDTVILEDLYLAIRAWDRRHPNLSLYGDSDGRCHICRSRNLTEISHPYRTSVSIFQAFKCNDCGAHNRVRFANKRSRKMLRGVAR